MFTSVVDWGPYLYFPGITYCLLLYLGYINRFISPEARPRSSNAKRKTDRSKLFKQKHHYRIYNTFQSELFFLIGLIQIFWNLILQSTASIPKFAFKKTGYLQAIELLFLFGFSFRLFCTSRLFCLKKSREGESIIFFNSLQDDFCLKRAATVKKSHLGGEYRLTQKEFFLTLLASVLKLFVSERLLNVKEDFLKFFLQAT